MNFLSWNYRGFDSKFKVESLRDLKKMTKPSVILLQETKMEASTILETTKKVFKATVGTAVISSRGASGGIVTLWDDQIWTLEVTLETQSCLLTVSKNKDNSNSISIVNVYMPTSFKDKMACWNCLSELKNTIDLSSCIIGGDFNTHLNLVEKKKAVKLETPSQKI
jgi:exonuclease III